MEQLRVSLSYEGNDATAHELDLYDISRALYGFQRSLALTTHLVLNGEVIVQAPKLQGAHINALPPERGSWEIVAVIAVTAGTSYKVLTAPKNTPLGHLVFSAYDYILRVTLGVKADYDKSLFQLIREKEDGREEGVIEQHQLDSVVEKTQDAIKSMHRPIYGSKTAATAKITMASAGYANTVGSQLNQGTFEYINYTHKRPGLDTFNGRVTSYNTNTFKGRMYLEETRRPVPFRMQPHLRSRAEIRKILSSLENNAARSTDENYQAEVLEVTAQSYESRDGYLKFIDLISIRQ